MRTEILSLLRERGDYVSGQELCERFGVSRTAVWKAVEQLKKDGYEIEAVRNRGYLLREEGKPSVFGRTELESRLRETALWAGKPLYYYESLDSTNLQAKRLAEEGTPHGALVVADRQTAGRGRRGRSWSSPAGSNLYFTILLRPKISPDKASMLTLVMALAIAEGISQVCAGSGGDQAESARATAEGGIFQVCAGSQVVQKPGIKWPNDIVLDGRKVCGILTEMSLSVEQDSIQYVVIGAGINVAKQDFPEEMRNRAVSLEEIYGPVGRSRLLVAVMRAFEKNYEEFIGAESLAPLKDRYEALLLNRGRKVQVLDPKGEFEGTALGIRDTGELLVELPEGEVREIYAGEVSVRGIYGYV